MSDTEKPDFGKVKHWYNSIVQDYLKVGEIHNVEVTYLEYAFDPVHAVLIEGEYVKRFGKDSWDSLVKKADSEIHSFAKVVNLFLISQEKELAYMFKDHTWKVLPTRSKIRNFSEVNIPMSYIQSDLITDVINERNIIAFKDYVIDMENYSGGFRKGEPADFVTISLNYEINSVPESRELELQSLINKILPNDKLKDYFFIKQEEDYLNSFKFFVKNPVALKNEILSGLSTAFMQVPESVAFSFVAGISPTRGMYSTFFMGIFGGVVTTMPGMVSGIAGGMVSIQKELTDDNGPLGDYCLMDRAEW
ncbi:hypothetical protein LPJ78_004624, partial [Coemansia sp. RSA 989]